MDNQNNKQLNFTVGPVMTYQEVLDIGAQDVPYFRNQSFSNVMLENEKIIKQLLKAEDTTKVVVLTGSGTLAMEASITNFCEKDDHLLIVNGGGFGKRFAELADCFGIKHSEINVGFGKVVTKEMLDEYQAKIDAGTRFTHLYVNLDETSTGTLYDLKLLSDFAKKNNLLFVVDAISAFLADEIDLSKTPIDVLITSSQKALALPPGISMLVLSEKAINKKTDIPVYYASVKMALDNSWRGQTPFTPAVQIILQLNARLKECIKNDTVAQTKKISAIIRNRMKELGFKEVSENTSNAVTAFYMIEGYSAKDMFKYLEDKHNIWICPNGGDIADTVFRIGNIGNITEEDIERLMSGIVEFLNTYEK